VSATVGAGDQGNARELARRLKEQGHKVEVRDFLDAAPLGIGRALGRSYEAELRHAPWSYELMFSLWYKMPFLLPPLAAVLSFFTARPILRWARQADVVVSTYPVATQVLGHLRARAKRRWRRRSALRVPAASFVTDFGYHPFWAHDGIDLNLAVHPSTVMAVRCRTGKPSIRCEPLVSPSFRGAAAQRARRRADLGLEDGELAVLISSGSWGVGDVRETFELLAGRLGLVPVVACGRNAALQRELEEMVKTRDYRAAVLGWTDDMAGLMAACDVLVENAGGLTSYEAMRSGLPLISFRPLAGHGRRSAIAMAEAGVSHLVKDSESLVERVEAVGRPGPARQRQLTAAAALFSHDASLEVAQLAVSGMPPLPRLRPTVRVARSAARVALAGALGWSGLTAGVGVAAAAGIGVAHPPPDAGNVFYLGVRLSPAELGDPAVRTMVSRLDASAVLSASVADREPGAVRALVIGGTDLESGGWGGYGQGRGPVAPWAQALWDSRSVHVLGSVADQPVEVLCPGRSLTAFDLIDANSRHLLMVVPNATLPLSPGGPYPRDQLAVPLLKPDQIYEVNGLRTSPSQLMVLLSELRWQVASQGLASRPLAALQ
jgi:processive 1,2-diacylglycerol beta-glucosyltransferase